MVTHQNGHVTLKVVHVTGSSLKMMVWIGPMILGVNGIW